MAEVPLPTPTQVPVPSTDIRNTVFAGAKLDEEVTGTGEFYTDRLGVKRLTNTGRNNKFNAAQQERESRFDAFIQSSGYDVIGDYTAGPLTITEYNQLIRYNNELYKLTAATDLPFTTAGNTDQTWTATDSSHFVSVGDAALRQNLASAEEGLGDNLVARTKGGTVHDAITDYYPLAYGADPSGQTSSTAAFRTTLEKFTDRTDSTFDGDVTRYPVIKLPDGVFVASNLTIPSMVIIEGSDNTIMVPENPNEFIWDTVNTSSSGGAATRLLRPVFRNIKFGYGFQNQIPGLTIKANAGAVRLINCSYPLFENCEFRFLDGEPIVLKSVWDATFDNTRIMYCGNTRDYNNIKYALNIGPADDDLQDGSNAINFKRIHIEGCPAMMRIGKRTRTISFTDVKMEYFRNNDPTTYAPSLFEGVDGVEFNNVELSWSNIGWPMFKAIGTSVMHDTSADDTSDYENDHCRGINFSSVQIKDSQNLSGDYFQYSSKRGPLVIDGGYIHHARYLLNGSDMILKNIVATQCGPYFGNLIDNNTIENVTIINHRVLPSGTFNIFSVSGKNNIFRDSQFSTPYGSNSNGCAWIAQSSTADLRVENVTFGGKMQWGIKGAPSAFQYKKFLNLKLTSDADYGELVQGGFSVDGLPTRLINNSGGAVTLMQEVAANTTAVFLGCIHGSASLTIRVENSAGAYLGAATALTDFSISTPQITGNLSNNFSAGGSGTPGDGRFYISSSGNDLSFTNRTTGTVKVYLISINAKM
ncbi:hypothetical protein [Klebsiella pneumoniae]|uniref:hypothetical protein n=1 Tax=Klebsiella pneumoniae TaxID=573 RepID=UPI0020A7D4EB|nr:hypothetical protein [Klebsiella pneumoniae]MCP3094000.1 hypothetical protein [Klebsiella pneumoniae]